MQGKYNKNMEVRWVVSWKGKNIIPPFTKLKIYSYATNTQANDRFFKSPAVRQTMLQRKLSQTTV